MTTRRTLGTTLAALAASGIAFASFAQAQQRERLSRQCRQEVIQLCGRDRAQIRQCLMQRAGELGESCRTELRQRMGESGGRPQGIPPQQEIAFGTDPLQRLDFYPAASGGGPKPLMLFVHGGGWKRGDKNNATGSFKAAHYTGLGYHFASTNYRLVPAATVDQQARDVAEALAELLRRADVLGIDRSRVVLMGHSAGAHLVSLVGTDPQYLAAAGLSTQDIDGIIPLDGAGYNVPDQMGENAQLMGETYRQAFGTDPARQQALSPTLHAANPNVAHWLVLHVERSDAKRQSEELAAALGRAGAEASVRAFEGRGLRGHGEINRRMGDPDYPATKVVDDWLATLLH